MTKILKYFLIKTLKKVESEYKDNYKLETERFDCSLCKSESNQSSANIPHHQSPIVYSTCQAVANDDKNIHKVIFNDKFALLQPTNKSDFKINFLAPQKSDYRKKRTVLLMPTPIPSDNSYISEYKQTFAPTTSSSSSTTKETN